MPELATGEALHWCGPLATDDIARGHMALITVYLRDNVCDWDAMSAALELPATQLCRVALRFGRNALKQLAEDYLDGWRVAAKGRRKHKYEG